MDRNALTADELRRAQRAMRLDAEPIESLSPLMRSTLAAVARCAMNRPAAPLPQPRDIPNADAKLRAAGDIA